jgi:ubiquinone/menaquinone biosynthesis C-methylase UbiE
MQREEGLARFFDSQAEGWEERNYPPETRARVRGMLDFLNLPQGGTVLDVGCGEGVLIPFLREIMGPEAKIMALDSSAAMLKGASAKDSAVQTIQARAEEMPLPDENVDIIACFSAFPHFENKDSAAAEFYRVLKPGGTAYVLHLGSREEINRHHDSHQAVKGDHLPCPEGMKQIFTRAGFGQLSLEERPGWYFFSARK